LSQLTRVLAAAHSEDLVPSLHRFDTILQCNGRTERQTDGRTPRRWLRRA